VTPRAAARAIFDAALRAGAVRPLVLRAVAALAPPPRGRAIAVGMGKASGAMAAALEEAWGERVAGGLVVVKEGCAVPTRRVRVVEASHPVPDERGVAAAGAIRALAETAGPDDLLLVLISGGGSALAPAPAPPVTLADKQEVTRLLLAAGAAIGDINAVRKHCSLLKGGQLARAAAARTHALVLSDVIGDPLDVIASGPTVPDASTFADALAVLDRFDIRRRTPARVVDRLERGVRGEIPETPKPGDPVFARVSAEVIANNALVVDAAADEARRLGLRPHVLTRAMAGEARTAAAALVALAREVRTGQGPVAPPACLIAGGEVTVTVRGRGTGGRCQELALAAALGLEGAPGVALLAAGTDGTDGPTDAAGAVVDGRTAARARALGLDPRARLDDNDSHAALAGTGDLVVTGPTATNLLDLYLVVVT
jgi:hydroxypyruvate reductase